ncbi:hypothetical protein S7711_09759 [Stachybotrys chartarum IBT 7711]|uniref:Uncharacterized protein n=1 Tax=Stachybotrys chartarum (strain CBS 109288 / IBT 7711) TaxID=1280523 RepID=A0A084B9X5_STACB|nr:hypothetical protein S7711_09759 [Stachybotrys chartarum IBT 7711]
MIMHRKFTALAICAASSIPLIHGYAVRLPRDVPVLDYLDSPMPVAVVDSAMLLTIDSSSPSTTASSTFGTTLLTAATQTSGLTGIDNLVAQSSLPRSDAVPANVEIGLPLDVLPNIVGDPIISTELLLGSSNIGTYTTITIPLSRHNSGTVLSPGPESTNGLENDTPSSFAQPTALETAPQDTFSILPWDMPSATVVSLDNQGSPAIPETSETALGSISSTLPLETPSGALTSLDSPGSTATSDTLETAPIDISLSLPLEALPIATPSGTIASLDNPELTVTPDAAPGDIFSILPWEPPSSPPISLGSPGLPATSTAAETTPINIPSTLPLETPSGTLASNPNSGFAATPSATSIPPDEEGVPMPIIIPIGGTQVIPVLSTTGSASSTPLTMGTAASTQFPRSSMASSTTSDEIIPSTTYTSLPSDAALLPVMHGTYESETFVTTQLEGSSEPTVVPLIFPIAGGAPLLCVHCLPTGSMLNAEVNIPGPSGFCVRILDIRIGSCPSRSGGGGESGGSGNGGGGGGPGVSPPVTPPTSQPDDASQPDGPPAGSETPPNDDTASDTDTEENDENNNSMTAEPSSTSITRASETGPTTTSPEEATSTTTTIPVSSITETSTATTSSASIGGYCVVRRAKTPTRVAIATIDILSSSASTLLSTPISTTEPFPTTITTIENLSATISDFLSPETPFPMTETESTAESPSPAPVIRAGGPIGLPHGIISRVSRARDLITRRDTLTSITIPTTSTSIIMEPITVTRDNGEVIACITFERDGCVSGSTIVPAMPYAMGTYKLEYDFSVEFLDSRLDRRDRLSPGRALGADPACYQAFDVMFRAGDIKWNSDDDNTGHLPHCENNESGIGQSEKWESSASK